MTYIDTVADVFGDLHRVWVQGRLRGTIYQSLDGSWVAQFERLSEIPGGKISPEVSRRHEDKQSAIAAILA